MKLRRFASPAKFATTALVLLMLAACSSTPPVYVNEDPAADFSGTRPITSSRASGRTGMTVRRPW